MMVVGVWERQLKGRLKGFLNGVAGKTGGNWKLKFGTTNAEGKLRGVLWYAKSIWLWQMDLTGPPLVGYRSCRKRRWIVTLARKYGLLSTILPWYGVIHIWQRKIPRHGPRNYLTISQIWYNTAEGAVWLSSPLSRCVWFSCISSSQVFLAQQIWRKKYAGNLYNSVRNFKIF